MYVVFSWSTTAAEYPRGQQSHSEALKSVSYNPAASTQQKSPLTRLMTLNLQPFQAWLTLPPDLTVGQAAIAAAR